MAKAIPDKAERRLCPIENRKTLKENERGRG
jgi:hypothetical protein